MSSTNDDLLDERKQRKLAQMSRRDEERKLNLQNKQDERKLITSTNVGRQYFEQEYPQMKNQIEDLFQQLSLNNNQNNNNSNTNNTTNPISIQDLADRLQKLEKFITEHVEILCSRDIANAQNDVLKLRTQLSRIQGENLSSNHRLDFTQIQDDQQPTKSSQSIEQSSTENLVISSNTITISNKQNQLIRFQADELHGKDVAIENLHQCEIFLKGVPSSLQIKNLQHCVLVVGPCSRSILIDQCQQSEFALACQQLRIHTSTECDFYVHATAQPIIEDCQNLRFAPYAVEYQMKQEHIQQSGLNWTKDYWNDIQDFNHLARGIPSPNWQIIEEEERKEWSLD